MKFKFVKVVACMALLVSVVGFTYVHFSETNEQDEHIELFFGPNQATMQQEQFNGPNNGGMNQMMNNGFGMPNQMNQMPGGMGNQNQMNQMPGGMNTQNQMQEPNQMNGNMPMNNGNQMNSMGPNNSQGASSEQLSDTTNNLETDEDYTYVSAYGNVSQEEYDAVIAYLDEIDEDIMETFAEEEWSIIIVDGDLDQILFRGSTNGVKGATYFDYETIYIEADLTYEYCTVHEIGHYIDDYFDMISNESEFSAIFKAEAKYLTEYGTTSVEEFFAEVYCYYVLDPDTLEANCPQAYSFMEELLEQF